MFPVLQSKLIGFLVSVHLFGSKWIFIFKKVFLWNISASDQQWNPHLPPQKIPKLSYSKIGSIGQELGVDVPGDARISTASRAVVVQITNDQKNSTFLHTGF